jgi:hypothetical protein
MKTKQYKERAAQAQHKAELVERVRSLSRVSLGAALRNNTIERKGSSLTLGELVGVEKKLGQEEAVKNQSSPRTGLHARRSTLAAKSAQPLEGTKKYSARVLGPAERTRLELPDIRQGSDLSRPQSQSSVPHSPFGGSSPRSGYTGAPSLSKQAPPRGKG